MQVNNNYTYKRNVTSIHSRKALVTVQRLRYRSVATISELENYGTIEKRGQHENSRNNLLNTYTGEATKSSMRRLQRCSDIFFMGRRNSHGLNPVTKNEGFYQAGFITLTIPDIRTIIDAKYGYNRFLKRFMQRIIYNFGVRDYVWKYEQQERGQAHWHIFVDRFCEKDKLKKFWIEYLDEEGLTEEYRINFKGEPSQACFVTGMRNEGELKWYLNNYLHKKTQNENPTVGHLWGASAHIKKMKLPTLPVTLEFINNVEKAIIKKQVTYKDIEIPVIGDHGLVERLPDGSEKKMWVCSIIRGLKLKITALLCKEQKKIYDQFILAYRQGDWKRTHDLCYDEAHIRWHYEQWRDMQNGGYAWKKAAEARLRSNHTCASPPV